jgi:hypothetical protein
MILGIIFFGVIISAGLLMFFKGAGARFYWPEVEGSILYFTESFQWSSPYLDDGPSQLWYIPTVRYIVKDKEYVGQSKFNLAWNKPDFAKNVTVLYDPHKPEDFHIKDNTMLVGCILFTFGLLAVLTILFLNHNL